MAINPTIIPTKIDLSSEVDNFTLQYNETQKLRLSDRFLRDEAENELRLTVLESNAAIEGANDDLNDIFIDVSGLNKSVVLEDTTSLFDTQNLIYRNDFQYIDAKSNTYFQETYDEKVLPNSAPKTLNVNFVGYCHTFSVYFYWIYPQTTYYFYIRFDLVFDDNTTASVEGTGSYTSGGNKTLNIVNPYYYKKIKSATLTFYSSSTDDNKSKLINVSYFYPEGQAAAPETRNIVIKYTSQKPTYCYLYLFDENNNIQNIGDITYKFTDGNNDSPAYHPYEVIDLTNLTFTPTHIKITQHNTTASHISKYVLLISTT